VIPAHVPPELVSKFNFREDAALRHDPWPYIASLHERPPIFFSPDLGGYWVVTRADMIDDVFSRYDLFTATSLAIPKIENRPPRIPNSMDPPQHTPYRKLLANNLFSPRALARLEEDSRLVSRELFAGFSPGECEFVHDYAYKLPIDIFLRMMGADLGLRDVCLDWVKLVFRGTTAEDAGRGFAAADAFVRTWLDEQLADPEANQGGMFRAMVESRIEGRELTRDEIHWITMMLFTGGLDTITSQMTHIMHFLAGGPEHREALVAAPKRIPVALEELLRRFGISFIGRAVAKDVEYHGVKLRQGDAIVAGTPIAGLDPQWFPEPLKVDFDRVHGARVKHLGFGAGPHLCIGAFMARTQIRVMLEELLPVMPGLHVAPGAVVENSPGATMMLKSLPLRWGAAK